MFCQSFTRTTCRNMLSWSAERSQTSVLEFFLSASELINEGETSINRTRLNTFLPFLNLLDENVHVESRFGSHMMLQNRLHFFLPKCFLGERKLQGPCTNTCVHTWAGLESEDKFFFSYYFSIRPLYLIANLGSELFHGGLLRLHNINHHQNWRALVLQV